MRASNCSTVVSGRMRGTVTGGTLTGTGTGSVTGVVGVELGTEVGDDDGVDTELESVPVLADALGCNTTTDVVVGTLEVDGDFGTVAAGGDDSRGVVTEPSPRATAMIDTTSAPMATSVASDGKDSTRRSTVRKRVSWSVIDFSTFAADSASRSTLVSTLRAIS